MDRQDETRILAVGRRPLGEEEMVLLSRARKVVGPETLVAAVAHLCPPTTALVVTTSADPLAIADEGTGPVVLLVPSTDAPRG